MPNPIYGWVTKAEADSYFSERPFSSDYWVSGADQIPSLQFAHRILTGSRRFSFPTAATLAMQYAQCEMALFLLQHMPDIDIRMGLRAQGIVDTGVLHERYTGREPVSFPIPPLVIDILHDFDSEQPFYITELERDEEEDVDHDAFSNLDRGV